MTYLIRQMGHLALGTPDPDKSAADLVGIVGVRETERADGTIYLTSNNRHHEVSYSRADKACVHAIGLEAVSREAVDEVHRRAKSDGLEILSDRPLRSHVDHAVRFVAPGGAILEVHTPVARTEPMFANGPGSRARRLEHVNCFVPDVAATAEFYLKTLGMKLSDQTEDGALRWFRVEDGYHHTMALGPGDGRMHHYAFDLRAMEDLAHLADTLLLDDRTLLWGPGRHGAGGNIFTYYIDPDGCIVENSVQMDRIDNDAVYEPRSWDISQGLAGRWINTWGTPPPATFMEPGLPFAA